MILPQNPCKQVKQEKLVRMKVNQKFSERKENKGVRRIKKNPPHVKL